MRLKYIFSIIFFLTACFHKVDDQKSSPLIATDAALSLTVSASKISAKPVLAMPILSKPQRESIYFSAHLEKEALKLLLKNSAFEQLTLFSVLSYIVETQSGVKKSPPQNLDCSRFRLDQSATNSAIRTQDILIYKSCQKPEILVARIEVDSLSADMKIIFVLKEWGPVVGLPVSLTGENIVCDLKLKDKKLEKLNCINWAYNVNTLTDSTEELRLKIFSFNRHDANQFVLKGGRYKDLVERNKVEIQVPLDGNIKLFEKEIKVIDDFAEQNQKNDVKPERIQIKGVPNEKEIHENSTETETSPPQETNTQSR